MEANFLNRKLDPKQFQEYCLSREVLQDPTDLWNGEEGILAGDALSNCSNRLLPISSGGVEQVEQVEQIEHCVHSVHLLAIGKTGCVHISDGPNRGISQQVSWQPHQQDAVLARDPFVSHHCANNAGNWLVLFTAGSLELVPLAAAGAYLSDSLGTYRRHLQIKTALN
ncbi:unnamed protein product [Symbiodinium natans]|uniref:Uncharacterized protein n=1 Tax=Symbiodinium natans TaxID=878477 RepID=A0A812JHC8_9DINO|nr:unnamed protein product [Symbiodinium natans]